MRGKYTYQNPQLLFQGSRFDVLEVEGQNSQGKIFKRQIVDHPGAVVILPLIDDKTILLIRNERQGVAQTLWELPAGTLEKGEEPLACAIRELEEETGYQTQSITPLLKIYSTPGFCNEVLFIFLAKELSFVGQHLEATENIVVEKIPFSKALGMIYSGEIIDSKTICALFYLHNM